MIALPSLNVIGAHALVWVGSDGMPVDDTPPASDDPSRQRRLAQKSPLNVAHPRFSLTHAGGLALAVALAIPSPVVTGVGVDYEPLRPLRPGAERFFLSQQERTDGGPLTPSCLIHYWTLKEALFKADPMQTRRLTQYELVGLRPQGNGSAYRVDGSRQQFIYASAPYAGGFVSVALAVIQPPV
jgi:phosphopantetheinyl transferase (holo-ACP synthase)